MDFDKAIDLLLSDRVEGGYSNNPADPGGETMWGITRRTAIRHGYTGMMRLLPRATAAEIYRKEYWDPNHTDSLPEVLRFPVFDATVNSGGREAALWLQRALGLPESGVISAVEIAACAKLVNPFPLACRFIAQRLEFQTNLPIWGQFSRGWSRRIALNLSTIAALEQSS